MDNYPKCFISYAWESQEHKNWVRFLGERLQENGVYTFLDQWDMSLGDQVPQFMESSIRNADFVLLVCTPTFASKANSGKGGVGYEKNIVSGEMFLDAISDKKFVAILRKGSPSEALPSYLKSKVFLDFRDDEKFDYNFEELLRHFYSTPRYMRPQLGKKPSFTTQEPAKPIRAPVAQKTITTPGNFNLHRDLFEFAKQDLGKLTTTAETWARENAVFFTTYDFTLYKDLFSFAKKDLGKLTTAAEQWARENISFFAVHDFSLFKELFSFAKKDLGKLTTAAEQWAKENIGIMEEHGFSEFKELFSFAKEDLGRLTTAAEKWAFENLKTAHR